MPEPAKPSEVTARPCPLCDLNDTGMQMISYGRPPQQWRVRCLVCLMEGPVGKTSDEALTLWDSLPRFPYKLTAAARAMLDFHDRIKAGTLPSEVAMMVEEAGVLIELHEQVELWERLLK